MRIWFGVPVLLAAGLPFGAQAQSFDCTKARTPSERAICAQPSLGALDRAVADAYAAALARPDANAAALQASEQAWLRSRDAKCSPPARGHASLAACLSAALTARLTALTPAAMPAETANGPATPAQAAPPPVTPAPVASPTIASPTAAAPSRVASPATAAPPPAIPVNVPPQADAALDQATQPATGPGSTLLHVRTAGRFSLQAHSATGASLQLVDMMSGPADPVGEPGVQDGRTDVLLDAGAYKLRVTPAEGATGDVALQVLPFQDAAPPAAIPAPGETGSSTLADLQQRAFWLLVGPGGAVSIDAAGRALSDLRLWQGGDLVPLQPTVQMTEPVRGHPMTALRLSGTVEPGTYLLVAYGGAPIAWADGDSAMPFHVRSGALPRLAEGWASGTVGPLGSEVFQAPPRATLFRLDLPASAAATLRVDGAEAQVAPNSREPSAALRASVNSRLVTVTGAAGQPYALRAQEAPGDSSLWRQGRYWVSAVMPGAGGEEVPPTALLVRRGGAESGRILASTAPPVGPDAAWRTAFNVRGPTTLLLRNTAPGDVAVQSASHDLGLLQFPPRSATLPEGIVAYSMSPPAGRQGVADLLFGTAAVAQEAAPRWPADPVVPFGVQTMGPGEHLELVANTAPGLTPGLLARPAPVALAEGPLAVSQMPGVPLTIPVHVARGGALAVADPAVGDLAATFTPDADGTGDVVLPAPDHPRTVVLAWRAPPARQPDIPAPPARAAETALAPATPRFLDLNDGAARSYDLQVPEGGLYRVETTGRLHTAAAIGTAFTPSLDRAEANGPGGNALLQRWLRAGRYRVRVEAKDSAGHLGLRVAPASLLDAPALLPSGTVRAALPAGAGLAIPVEITQPGRYRLELLGQDRSFNARLDDAEGWPLTAPGPLTELERDLPAGRLRLLLAPEAVDARVLARLQRVLPSPEYAGHGPRALVPETPAQATWREPGGRDEPRTPDAWTFTLRGDADATLTISDGMVADLHREGEPNPVLRLLGPTPFQGRLEAGLYRLEATSLGRNDRLDYTLALATAELQPGIPRKVAPDAQVPFTLADPGVVSLTSFGPLPVKAVLRDGGGAVIGRYGARGTDWNIAVSRPLPAGSYRLDLAPAEPPGMSGVTTPSLRPDDPASDADADAAPRDETEPDAQTPARQTNASSADTPDASDPPDASGTADAADAAKRTVELTLALPEPRAPIPATASAALTGGGVHRLLLPQPSPGTLLLATAQSSTALILAIERQHGDTWDTVTLDEGTAPIAAIPADGDAAPWRMSVWAVDGGTLPIQAGAAVLDPPATALDALAPRLVDGAAVPVAVGRVLLDTAAPVRLAGSETGLVAGGWPGHPLTALDDGLAVPQGDTLWVVARTAGPLQASPVMATPGEALAVPVPAGGTARLAGPAPPAGTTRVWLAQSGLGQPGLDAGGGMGITPGSALALGSGPVRVWNAGGGDVLRPRVTALDLATLPAQRLDGPLSVLLPPRSALFLTMPEGDRRTDLVLAPGTAAALDGAVAWAGGGAMARSLPGSGTSLVLLNTGAQPAPASVSWTASPPGQPLRPGMALKRFFGAAGSFDLPVEAPPGARLMLAGDVQAVFTGGDGRVLRGNGILPGPGRLTLTYAPGPLAAWLDVPGVPAWPSAGPQPQAVPAQVALTGPAMALTLPADSPVLLHARTTAPVILTLGDAPPTLYPAGAVLSRYMAVPTVLRVDSPHDGPLSGTLELTADPVTPIADGLGDPVALAPGDAAVFAFRLAQAAEVGVGVRADPDRAEVRLLAADGALLGEGTAMLRTLPAGRYLLEARLPADAPPAVVRPAVVGIAPRPSGPPPEVARAYLELVGLAPKDPAR